MLEVAESQHTNAQEILSFQAYSRRVGTNANSAKPSQYNLVSDWDDCVPEWHKSLTAPHFKDRRDLTPLCNHSLIVHETFTGTENGKYYHTTAAFPYLSNNLCFPNSATRLHGQGLLERDAKRWACSLTHHPVTAARRPRCCLGSCSCSASLMFNWLSSPLFHKATQKLQFQSWKQSKLYSSVTGCHIFFPQSQL